MRVLVTGGAGFIGSHLTDALIARGDEVLILDDLSTGSRSNLSAALGSGARLVEGSVTDAAVVDSAFSSIEPDVVFHVAGQIDVRRSVRDPGFDADVNIGGTINVLESARAHGDPKIIFSSTGGAIYGDVAAGDLPTPETFAAR